MKPLKSTLFVFFSLTPLFLSAQENCPVPQGVLDHFDKAVNDAYVSNTLGYIRDIYWGKDPNFGQKDQRILFSKSHNWELDLKKPFAVIYENEGFFLIEARAGLAIPKKMLPFEKVCLLYVVDKNRGQIESKVRLKKEYFLGHVFQDVFYFQYENRKKTYCLKVGSKE